MNKRTCENLGFCQNHQPACKGCKPHLDYPFAPGVIERGPRHKHAALKRQVVDFAGACFLVALAFFVAGCLL